MLTSLSRIPSLALCALLATAPFAVHAAEDGGLSLNDVEVLAEQGAPEVCFSFSAPLKAQSAADLAQFIGDGDAKLAGRITGERLCLEGVQHGASYNITLRAGLSAETGASLAEAITRQINVPDRTPQLMTPAKGSILPAAGPLGVPVRTVNMEELEIKLLRVHPGNMDEWLQSIASGLNTSQWEASRIADEDGELIWEGKADLSSAPRNAESSTLIPLKEMTGELQPGAYLMMATGIKQRPVEYEWRDKVTVSQWLVVTDIGLTSIKGRDGLTVLARSLADATPRPRISVELWSANEKILAEATTDINGRVTFQPQLLAGKGGNRPVAVHARQGGDFAVLAVEHIGIDLTRLGIEGKTPVGELDLHLFAERGIWRAGETVHLTGLLRNARAGAAGDVPPITLKLIKPDGQEFARYSRKPADGGAVAVEIDLPDTAPAGQWQVTAHLGGDGPEIGRIALPVRDFVPPRLEVELEADDGAVKAGETLSAEVQADYYHGAPGAGLNVSAELVISADAKPFGNRWAGTYFGIQSEDVPGERIPASAEATDGKGHTVITAPIPDIVDITRPLAAKLEVSVFDIDGRPVQRNVTRPFIRDGLYLGIKPGFENRAPMQEPAGFSIIAVDQDGAAVEGQKLDWRVRELHYDWLWSRDNDRWSWMRVTKRGAGPVVAQGSITSGTDFTQVTAGLDWGRYEIEVIDAETGAIAAWEFAAGWSRLASDDDTPEQIRVEIDMEATKAADNTIRAFVKPPFAGEITLLLTDGTTRSLRREELPAEGGYVEIPRGSMQRPGAWLMAMGWRGFGNADQGDFLPRRAMGAAWVPMGVEQAKISAKLIAPEVVRPREKATIKLAVDGLQPGETAHAVLHAVDMGVLRMTRHKGPGLLSHYLDPRRPDLSLHDFGGRLIDATGLDFAKLTQGGDDEMDMEAKRALEDQLSGLPVRAYKVIALSSGIITMGADGMAEVEFDIPDVNTGLRLSAAIWTDDRLGETSTEIKLRDPVLAELTRPRFMAPGDIADVLLAVDLTDGKPGTYTATLATEGPLTVQPMTVDFGPLQPGASPRKPITLIADNALGAGVITMTLTGPDGFELARRFDLGVRAASPLITQRQSDVMVTGQSARLDPAAHAASFVPGTLTADLTIAGVPDFGTASLLRQLSLYPYGCSEQTTSKAMPLLVYADRAEELGLPDSSRVKARIQDAISRLIARQSSNGSFGMWSADSYDNLWLTAYVTDFMQRAAKDGYDVPASVTERALGFIAREAFSEYNNEPRNFAALAYGAMVLAKSGRTDLVSLDRLRWVADNRADKLPGALAPAQLATALAARGDEARARALFNKALRTNRADGIWLADYGSSLRDRAAVLALAAESGLILPEPLSAAAFALDRDVARKTWLSTQERSWLLLAARALADSGTGAKLTLNGVETVLDGGNRIKRHLTADAAPILARNTGETRLISSLALTGIPLKPLEESADGYAISRRYFTRDGQLLDGQRFTKGDQIVVVIDGALTDTSIQRDTLVVDLLPAGLEPDLLELDPNKPGYDWLGRGDDDKQVEFSNPTHRELRDDRYIAALTLSNWQPRIRLAYQLRAVTSGTFTSPGVMVEDMYAPELNARGPAGTVVITE